jgi:DNA-binding response OmpR family regulator
VKKIARIYIVEDDENLQQLYKMFLSMDGHEIVGQTQNGYEAFVDLYFNYQENPPEILILDYKLPGKDGLEVLDDLMKLRKLDSTLVLFITGDQEVELDALRKGAARFVPKPCDFRQLGDIVREILYKQKMKLEQFA